MCSTEYILLNSAAAIVLTIGILLALLLMVLFVLILAMVLRILEPMIRTDQELFITGPK